MNIVVFSLSYVFVPQRKARKMSQGKSMCYALFLKLCWVMLSRWWCTFLQTSALHSRRPTSNYPWTKHRNENLRTQVWDWTPPAQQDWEAPQWMEEIGTQRYTQKTMWRHTGRRWPLQAKKRSLEEILPHNPQNSTTLISDFYSPELWKTLHVVSMRVYF